MIFKNGDGVLGFIPDGTVPGLLGGSTVVAFVELVGVWQAALLAPPGPVTGFCSLDTGCCQKAYGGHSGRGSLGSLSERLGMGRAGSRMASPLRSTHTQS